MCALFNTKNPDMPDRNNSTVHDGGKQKVIEQMYSLGFEVGYYHHSEVGWAKESYNKLLNNVIDNSFKDLLENYYIKGKTDGVEKKKLDFRVHTAVIKNEIDTPILHIEHISLVDDLSIQDGVARPYAPTAQASMTSKPSVVNKPIVVNLPQSLSGFRLLKPSK